MNKIFSLSLIFAVVVGTFSSCLKTEEDDIFDKSAAERLNEASGIYSARLSDSKGGWVMEYYPTWLTEAPTGNGFLICTTFNADGSAKMAMNNVFSGSQYLEETSAWQVITDDGPVLTFNTHNNVIHAFSDPEDLYQTSGDDETGVGAEGDYEFIMVDVPENGQFITLKGKKRGTYSRMTRLPEGTDFQEYLQDIKQFQQTVFSPSAPNYCILTVEGDTFKSDDISSGIVYFEPYEGVEIASESYYPFCVTKRNDKYYMRLRDKFEYFNASNEETKEYDFQELVYDKDNDIFVDENNPENTLVPEPVSDFFERSFSNASYSWTWNASSEMSDSYAVLYNNLKTSFSKVKYTLQSLAVRSVADNCVFRVSYKTGKSNATADFVLTPSFADGKVSFAYNADATKDTSKKVLAALPDLQTILDQLTKQPFAAGVADSKWNLNSLKLISSSDANMWFVVKG